MIHPEIRWDCRHRPHGFCLVLAGCGAGYVGPGWSGEFSFSEMEAYIMIGSGDPGIPVMGQSFEQQPIAYGVIQIAAIGCIVASVYVLGTDFWERLNRAFEWRKPISS